jgi:hypothetical protein
MSHQLPLFGQDYLVQIADEGVLRSFEAVVELSTETLGHEMVESCGKPTAINLQCGALPDISWFINPINYSYKNKLYSYWSYKPT